jgi:hypothetical protein
MTALEKALRAVCGISHPAEPLEEATRIQQWLRPSQMTAMTHDFIGRSIRPAYAGLSPPYCSVCCHFFHRSAIENFALCVSARAAVAHRGYCLPSLDFIFHIRSLGRHARLGGRPTGTWNTAFTLVLIYRERSFQWRPDTPRGNKHCVYVGLSPTYTQCLSPRLAPHMHNVRGHEVHRGAIGNICNCTFTHHDCTSFVIHLLWPVYKSALLAPQASSLTPVAL